MAVILVEWRPELTITSRAIKTYTLSGTKSWSVERVVLKLESIVM